MPNHGRNLPAGFGLHGEGVSAAKLALELRALCAEHRVNTIHDLPPDVFQRAAAIQAELDRLRSAQRVKLAERGQIGLARSHANARVRYAARLNAFREAVAARGGPVGVNRTALARDLGVSRSTVQKFLRMLNAEAESGPPLCHACGRPLPTPRVLSVEHSHEENTNDAAMRRGEPRT